MESHAPAAGILQRFSPCSSNSRLFSSQRWVASCEVSRNAKNQLAQTSTKERPQKTRSNSEVRPVTAVVTVLTTKHTVVFYMRFVVIQTLHRTTIVLLTELGLHFDTTILTIIRIVADSFLFFPQTLYKFFCNVIGVVFGVPTLFFIAVS